MDIERELENLRRAIYNEVGFYRISSNKRRIVKEIRAGLRKAGGKTGGIRESSNESPTGPRKREFSFVALLPHSFLTTLDKVNDEELKGNDWVAYWPQTRNGKSWME
jgi:hypothetical protein